MRFWIHLLSMASYILGMAGNIAADLSDMLREHVEYRDDQRERVLDERERRNKRRWRTR